MNVIYYAISVNTETVLSDKYHITQNYPDPFNPITMINYQLPMTSDLEISIYNLLGQKVATLVSTNQNAGSYQVEWDANGFANGVYYYQLRVNKGIIHTKKMILMR